MGIIFLLTQNRAILSMRKSYELWTRWKNPDIPTPSSDNRPELLCPPRKTMESRIYSYTNVAEARNVILVQNRHSKNLQYINFDTLPYEPDQPRASLEKTFDGFTEASQYRYSLHGVSKWLESSTVVGVLIINESPRHHLQNHLIDDRPSSIKI